jgi:hypothetical protein
VRARGYYGTSNRFLSNTFLFIDALTSLYVLTNTYTLRDMSRVVAALPPLLTVPSVPLHFVVLPITVCLFSVHIVYFEHAGVFTALSISLSRVSL